ncbi:hypothetical protein SELMODRAFT_417675 [Selaginella moellendorffii]|uniref:Uncharacterized protein n=1 Tax=Selaginella moellendorffii TaxID=88036 RepID=D8S377_SELML|nr:hypothetical protein SELMODRAFT_417675 [Selaginella moellendorffii]
MPNSERQDKCEIPRIPSSRISRLGISMPELQGHIRLKVAEVFQWSLIRVLEELLQQPDSLNISASEDLNHYHIRILYKSFIKENDAIRASFPKYCKRNTNTIIKNSFMKKFHAVRAPFPNICKRNTDTIANNFISSNRNTKNIFRISKTAPISLKILESQRVAVKLETSDLT